MSQQALVVVWPSLQVSHAFNRNFFWHFGLRICWFHLRREPKKLFGHEKKIRSEYQHRDVLDESGPADLRVSTNPPSHKTLDRVSSYHQVFPHQVQWRIVLHQYSSRNQRRSTVWSISDHQEVLRISVRILATSLPVQTGQFERERQHSEIRSVPTLTPNANFRLVFLHFEGLWINIYTNLRLLRRYWAEWKK